MKRTHINRVVAVFVFIAILLCIPTKASAYPVSYRLDFPTELQEKTQWCWVASSCAVIKYYGGNVSQAGLVYALRGNVDNEPGSMAEMQHGLSIYSISSTFVSYALTMSQVRLNTYSNRRPVIARIEWPNGDGHAVVVTGYIDNSSLGDHYLAYMDPWYGEIHVAEYSEFVSSNRQIWESSLTNIH